MASYSQSNKQYINFILNTATALCEKYGFQYMDINDNNFGNGLDVQKRYALKLCYFDDSANEFRIQALNYQSFIIDAQLIQLSIAILHKLGLENFIIQLNAVGCNECRREYAKLLREFYDKRKREICTKCRDSLRSNPFEVFMCCAKPSHNAPQMIDYLCSDCHEHFKSVLETLDELDIVYELNPYLFGSTKSYYSRIYFEILINNTLIARELHRTDLIKQLKIKNKLSTGVSLPLSKIISQLKTKRIKARIPRSRRSVGTVFLAQLGPLAKKRSLSIFDYLLQNNFAIEYSFATNKLIPQLRLAEKLGIRIILILGQKEAMDNEIIVRDSKTGWQETIRMDKLLEVLRKRIN